VTETDSKRLSWVAIYAYNAGFSLSWEPDILPCLSAGLMLLCSWPEEVELILVKEPVFGGRCQRRLCRRSALRSSLAEEVRRERSSDLAAADVGVRSSDFWQIHTGVKDKKFASCNREDFNVVLRTAYYGGVLVSTTGSLLLCYVTTTSAAVVAIAAFALTVELVVIILIKSSSSAIPSSA